MATSGMRQLDAPVSRPDSTDVSPCTPNTICSTYNAADKIERHLRADGHRIWGFVVYRCTYTSDRDWDLCVQRIHSAVRKGMDVYNGRDLLQEGCFKLTVIADASMFDGASTRAVRQHFQDWCARIVHEEQGSPREIRGRQHKPPPGDWLLPVRYRFCIQINEASMRSFIPEQGEPWVKIIKSDWDPSEARTQRRQPPNETGLGRTVEMCEHDNDHEGDFTDDNEEEEYPDMEGCKEEDVGWMKVQLTGLMPDMYADLRSPNLWDIQYIRPPDMPEF
ncbi:hypothetical protein PG993_005845 [Apiospora rasikravindrae]|uniref:Uncharacterized protein n=1 Tax=Apiospora rasikravindrae TaxID=990691 RepID=A0ABR1TBQ6_9PEZI